MNPKIVLRQTRMFLTVRYSKNFSVYFSNRETAFSSLKNTVRINFETAEWGFKFIVFES